MSREIHRRSVRIEHGPRDAYYSNLPDMRPHPVIQCLCGWFPQSIADTWAGVGEMFDLHIKESLRADTAQFIEATVAALPPEEKRKRRK